MSDSSGEEQGPKPKSAWPLSLYIAAVVLILGCGILVKTIGESTAISDPRSDDDTVIYDRHGVELGRFHSEINMVPVTLENMAPILGIRTRHKLWTPFWARPRIWAHFSVRAQNMDPMLSLHPQYVHILGLGPKGGPIGIGPHAWAPSGPHAWAPLMTL